MSQDTRCWYYRAGWSCYRAGGNICYADTPTAINREHAILGADRCVAVNPSDTAPALVALDAQMVIRSARGERVVEAEDFFIGPGTDITRMTVLAPDELLTAIRIPADVGRRAVLLREGARSQRVGLPAVERGVGDELRGRHDRAHPHGGERRRGAAAAPACRRSSRRGPATQRGDGRERAGEIAIEGAQALRYNAYKVPLMRNLVKRAIRGDGDT